MVGGGRERTDVEKETMATPDEDHLEMYVMEKLPKGTEKE